MSPYATPTFRALVVVGALLCAAPAWSQSAQPSDQQSEPSTARKMQRWTQKQWDELTQEWRQDRTKWNACNKRAAAEKLKGQDVWTYIYGCMKT